MTSALNNWTWQPPDDWLRITTLDMHTGGEPLRVPISGLPPLRGRTVLEKRRYFREHYDHLRTGLMWEPRGHADMYGAVVTPSENADLDVFFLHNEGYSTMCGHAIIALTTLAIETGFHWHNSDSSDESTVQLTFNVPAGRVFARARVEGGRARNVTFRNVPSFLYLSAQNVEVPGVGRVHFDIAYGGAFYAIVEASQLGLGLTADHYSQLIDYGRRIKLAVMNAFSIEHPFEKDLSFLYGTIFTGTPQDGRHHSRNVCVFADGEVDRSATGTGVSARAALHYARGEVRQNDQITIESIIGSTMNVRVVESTSYGPYSAVVPEVGGSSYIVGRSECFFDPEDPLGHGFMLR